MDSSSLVGDFWLLVARSRAFVSIDRVESKSNLADGPSRFSFSVKSLGAVWTPPEVRRSGAVGGELVDNNTPEHLSDTFRQRGENALGVDFSGENLIGVGPQQFRMGLRCGCQHHEGVAPRSPSQRRPRAL